MNVQLIKAANDSHLWADTFDRKLTDVFAVESEIAKSIADTLKAKLTDSEEHAISARPTENTYAHQSYLKGRYFWNKRTGPDLQTAIDYFKQAIEQDSNYALAYAGLADSHVLLPYFGAGTLQQSIPPANAAAQKALELDPTLAEPHSTLGLILYYAFDFSQSKKEFERAIALDPNDATAHQWFGNGPLIVTGEFDRAIAEGKRAVELDPLSLVINTDLAVGYTMARRYPEAIEQFNKILAMDPRFYYARWTFGLALQCNGQLPEAIAQYKKAAELTDDPFVLAWLAQGYAKAGQRDEALKLLAQMEELATKRYVGLWSFAIVHLALGEKGPQPPPPPPKKKHPPPKTPKKPPKKKNPLLFIDIVGYSKLLNEEQKERLNQLTEIVLATAQVREATDEQLVRLPTGDGMALVFRHSAEEPARCALEIAEGAPEAPGTSGAHGHSQRAGERGDRRERAHQHRRGRDQHGATGDGLRRRRAHSSLPARGG